MTPGLKGCILAGFTALAWAGAASAQDSPTAEIKEFLAEVNKTMPQTVDDETRLDRMDAAHGEVVYYYTLVNYTYDQLDWPVVVDIIRETAVNNYCGHEEMASFRNGGIGLLYIYNDKNGELTGTLKIPADSCDEAEG